MNNYAISSADIADSLTRSSAAMKAAGNDLAQTVALTAAANTTIQDPDSVGNALKVLSMRIRGVKTELEDAGESTEGMAENTSKLREKVLALTNVDGKGGVDLLTDTGAFKSTYDIIVEIGKVWKDMDNMSQAALLELVAGKQRGSVVAALFENVEIIEKAYGSAVDAEGSAMHELETHLNSISGRVEIFKNALQTMWMNTLESDFLKGLVDIGTELVKLIDKVGLLKSILIAIAAIKLTPALFKGFGLDKFAGIFKKKLGSKAIEGTVQQILSLSLQATLAKAPLMQLAARITGVGVASLATMTPLQMLSMGFEALKIKGLAAITALKGFFTNPVVLAITAIAAAAAAAAVAYDALTTSHKEYKKQLKDSSSALLDTRSELQNLETELKTTKDRIEELESKGSLTFTEQEELNRLKAYNQELERTKALETQREQAQIARVARDFNGAIETDKLFNPDLATVNRNNAYGGKPVGIDADIAAYENANKRVAAAQEELTTYLENGGDLYSKQGKRLEKDLAKAEEQAQDAAIAIDDIQSKFDEYLSMEGVEWQKAEDGEELQSWQKQMNENLRMIYDYQDQMAIASGYSGAKTNAFSRIFGDQGTEAALAFKDAYENAINDYGVEAVASAIDFEELADQGMLDSLREVQKVAEESGKSLAEVIHGDDFKDSGIKQFFSEIEKAAFDAGVSAEDFLNIMDLDFSAGPELLNYFDKLGLSADEAQAYFLQVAEAAAVATQVASKNTTISKLTSDIEGLNAAQQTTNEIAYEGQAISEEYYNTLSEQLKGVVVEEGSFADAIDTSNGNIVKNTKLLNKLIKQKKDAVKTTAREAKAQSMLHYRELAHELSNALLATVDETGAIKNLTDAQYENISSLRQQISALENTIREYALLELQLSDAANAYAEFEEAKARDAELTYGDSMVEMLGAIDEGLKTGKVGTETFQAAVKALVPESVYADCDNVIEKMDAIHSYLTSDEKLSDYFTIDDSGNFSITAKNIESFIKDCQEAELFTNTGLEDFELTNNVQSLKDFADGLGVTEAAALAMVTELSKYDATWNDILRDVTSTQLEREFYKAVDAEKEAAEGLEEFWKAGMNPYDNADDYNKLVNNITEAGKVADEKLEQIKQVAKEYVALDTTLSTFNPNTGALKGTAQDAEILSGVLTDLTGQDVTLAVSDDGSIKLTQDQIALLSEHYHALGENPPTLGIQANYEEIQASIAALEAWINAEDRSAEIEINGKVITDITEAQAELESLKEEAAKIESEYDIVAGDEKTSIEDLVDYSVDGLTIPIKIDSKEVQDFLEKIKKIENGDYDVDLSGSSSDGDGSSKKDNSEKKKTKSKKEKGKDGIKTDTETDTSSQIDFGEVFKNVNNKGKEIASSIGESFTKTFEGTGEALSEYMSDEFESVNNWGANAADNVKSFFSETVPQKASELKESAAQNTESINNFGSDVASRVGEFFGKVKEDVSKKLDPFNVGKTIGSSIRGTNDWGAKVASNIRSFFGETVPKKASEFKDSAEKKIESVNKFGSKVASNVGKFFTETLPDTGQTFKKYMSDELGKVNNFGARTVDNIKTFFTDTLPTATTNAFTNVNNFGAQISGKVQEFFSSAAQKIGDAFSGAGMAISNAAAFVSSTILAPIANFLNVTVTGKIHEIFNGISTFVTQTVPSAIATLNSSAAAFFQSLPGKVQTLWTNAIASINTGASTALSTVRSGISSFFSGIPGILNGLWSRIRSAVSSFVAGINVGSGGASGASHGSRGGRAIYAKGTARAKGNAHKNGAHYELPSAERNAIVGEVGEELVVDVDRGIYYTVGSNGTEMVDLPKHAIVYNHKETEQLLKHGHTSRGHIVGGLSFAKGNAHYGILPSNRYSSGLAGKITAGASSSTADAVKDNTSAVKDNTSAVKDAADKFSEIIDWIDVLFSRIESVIADQEAIIENKLDSIIAISDKTPNYNIIFEKYTQQLIASQKAAAKYQQLANEAMSGLSADIIDKIKNGAIDITQYTDEATVEKINEALDYQEKALEYTRKIEETTAEIAATGKKEFDDKQQAYENAIAQVEHLNDLYQVKNELSALKYGFGANAYLKAQISGNLELLELLERERKDLKATLQSGRVPVNSQEWYDMVEAIHDVDDAIVDCETSLEDLQNEINDLHWEAFDELINRFDYIGSDIENLIQLLSRQVNELVEEDLAKLTSSNWANKEGITTLGLYAQEMERAQYVANKYAKEIKELQANKDKYNEVEYTAKLNELISAQYESIEQYYEAKDAIIELNEARVDAIEEGIQEEIDAYSELIEKKKELLDEEQKLHEFNKTVTEQAKDIAKIEKQLAAMAGDDTAATVAKRKQLEAELMEAREELEETYYDHSMDARQEALDKELADFEEEKNKEIEKWKEWLTDTEKVLDESFEYVQANTKVVYDTLTALGAQYSLTLNDSLVNPWMSGMSAIDNYSSKFSAAISSFTKELDKLAASWNKLLSSIENNASSDIIQTDKDSNLYVPTSGKYTESDFAPGDITAATVHKVQTGTTTSGTIKVGGQINAGNAKIYGGYNDTTGEKQYFSSDPVYTVLEEKNGMLKVRWHGLSSGVTGYFKKSDVKAVGGTTTPTYSYADSNNKTIEDYSKEYYAAKNSGNVQGMMAANNAANAIRKALGQALQSAGQDIANVANSTGYTGPTNKGQSNAAVYSTYKDEYGYTVDDYSKKYQAARAAGNADQMQLYNDRANAIRRKLGIAIQDASKDIAAVRAKYQYASGINKVKEDQIALIDELGEELVVHTDGRGRLKYLEKGSGVVPANLTERLIDFATDPTSVIDSMAPSIKAPRITSQNFNINMEFGELVHVDSVSKDTLPELQKMVRTEFNSLMREVNNGLRRAQKGK